MGKRRVNFQRCWLPVSRIGLHRRGVERVNCGPKLLDLGEKGVYSSYTLSAAGQKEYVHAHRGETGCERGFKHIARQARILPITTRWRWSPRRKTRPAAMPTRKAVSAVIAPSLALPRIPSVPKYLRTIRSIILSSGRPQRGHAC